MPRVSTATADAVQSALGFQSGRGEVVDAEWCVHQFYNKDKAKAGGRFLALHLKIQKKNEDGEILTVFDPRTRQNDPDFADVYIPVGFGTDDLAKMRPGMGASEEDEDPADLGDEEDAAGNMLYVDDSSVGYGNGTSLYAFNESLEVGVDVNGERVGGGFRPDKLVAGWAPNYIGLDAQFDTVATGKKSKTSGKAYTNFIAKQIYAFGYDTKPAGGKAKAKSTAAPKTAAAPKVATAAAPAPASVAKPALKLAGKAPGPVAVAAAPAATSTKVDYQDMAMGFLSELVEKYAAKEDPEEHTITRASLQTQVQSIAMKAKVKGSEIPKVVEFIKDDEWLTEQGSDAEGTILFQLDAEAGTITFGPFAEE